MQKIYIILKDITESGGGERVCVNLSNAFSEIGFEVSIISFFRVEKDIAFSLNENINVRFLSHTTPKSKNPLKKLFNKSIYRYILSKKVDTIAQQEKPDIVLANDGWYIPKTKLDSIQYIRLWHLKAPKKIDKRKQKIFHLFDTLVVLSPRELDIWQNYHKNIKVIPNFLPNISQKNTDSNQHRIISVGRLSAEKGFLRLIDIWEKVQERMGGLRGLGRKNDENLDSNLCYAKPTSCHTDFTTCHTESPACHTEPLGEVSSLNPNPCHVERSETSKTLVDKNNNPALNIQNKTTKDSNNSTQLTLHTYNDINQDSTPHQNKHCIESSNNIGFNIYTALILFIYGAILYGGSLGMIDFYLQELAIQSSHLQDFDTHAFNPLNINIFSTQAFDIYHATLLNQALISFVLLVLLYISNKEIGILALFSFILFYIFSGKNASLLECFICPYLWLYSIFYIVYRILLRFYRFVS